MKKKLIFLTSIFIVSSLVLLIVNTFSSAEKMAELNKVDSIMIGSEEQLIINGFDYIRIEQDASLTNTVEVFQPKIWEQKEKKLGNDYRGTIIYEKGELLYQVEQSILSKYTYETSPFIAYMMFDSKQPDRLGELVDHIRSRYIIRVPSDLSVECINFKELYNYKQVNQ